MISPAPPTPPHSHTATSEATYNEKNGSISSSRYSSYVPEILAFWLGGSIFALSIFFGMGKISIDAWQASIASMVGVIGLIIARKKLQTNNSKIWYVAIIVLLLLMLGISSTLLYFTLL